MRVESGVSLTRRLEELFRFERSGMRPGLEGVERLLEAAGRPDRRFPSVLIAGTNGKGSTAAHLASILRAAGWRTGLYTSPHLLRFHERIRVDGREIADEALEGLLSRWWPVFAAQRPSFFEAATALCFDHFASSGLDMAVVEVGLGGRLDSTNILAPRLSIITTISLDHAEILGSTARRIAIEKAGIVKEGGALALGVRSGPAREAILEVVAARGARVVTLGRDARYATLGIEPGGTSLRLATRRFRGVVRTPLLGAHQARNAALAAMAAEILLEELPDDRVARALERGIAAARWPARAERIPGDPPVLVDVAHNTAGAAALAATIPSMFPSRPVAVVAGFAQDKDHDAILRALAPATSRFFLTEFAGERATPADQLLRAAPPGGPACEAVPLIPEAVARAKEWARSKGGAVVITGSFFVIAEALPALGREVPREI
jgi:dihydrofolate synthase/folylpolyglutamate synthase